MKRAFLAILVPLACSSGFPERRSTLRFAVAISDPTDLGSDTNRRTIVSSPDGAERYTVRVEALKLDGSRDTSFSGYVRLSAKPGTVLAASGPGVSGRSVKLEAGFAEGIQVPIYNAFGDARIVAEDIGYVPVEPGRTPPPTCSDGIDNDQDGSIDFPADDGCAFANDDTEQGGSFAAGASPIIYYKLPRVSDLRGATCTGAPPVCGGGAATPFKAQQVQIDSGYRQATKSNVFDVIVTRVASNGFYVQDIENDRAAEDPCASPPVLRSRVGFGGVFAFNFNSPPGMRVCDRMRALGGTATEFFGSIQLGYPTWSLEEWVPKDPMKAPEAQDPRARDCGVPEPKQLLADDISNQNTLLSNVHSFVRVATGTKEVMALDASGNAVCDTTGGTRKPKMVSHTTELRVTKHFGEGFAPTNPNYDPQAPGSVAYLPNETASNCDLNKNGSVDFEDPQEKLCSDACTADVECTEWSNFVSRTNFFVVVKDTFKDDANKDVVRQVKIQADGSTSPQFNPLTFRGQVLRAFSGTLGYFSGGNQFTIEARCADDVVTDVAQTPKDASSACVFPRSATQLEETQ